MTETEALKLNKKRVNLYMFLSHLYLMEVDAEMLQDLKMIAFPEGDYEEELAEGYKLMKRAIDAYSEKDLEQLAADYAATFLAAGIAQGNGAFPYESVYTSRRKLVGQEARSRAADMYCQFGLKLGKPVFKIPEDHISVEFDFMAYLCGQWASAGDSDKRKDILEFQKRFFEEHLYNWVLLLGADAERYATTDFYKGLAKITRGFMRLEKDFLT